jgi:hypothetical protein|tara:strand:+ start:667 stop:888 length:222 start_codon:yes stop_codon:yes gene_type:complete
MDSEDALKAKAEKDLKLLKNELENKARQMVEETKRSEKEIAEQKIAKVKEDYNSKLDLLQDQLKDLNDNLLGL